VRGYSPSVIVIDESQSIDDTMYWSDIRGAGAAVKGLTADDFRHVEHLSVEEQQNYFNEVGVITRIIECGTPLGRNHFWKVTQPGYSDVVIKQPWWESPVTSRKLVEKDRRKMPRQQFEAEYCCVFYRDSAMAFPIDQVEAACHLDPNPDKGYERKDRPFVYYVGGLDLGQSQDHSALTIMEVTGPVRKMVFHKQYPLDAPWYEMVADWDLVVRHWKPHYILVDRTGAVGIRIYGGYLRGRPGWNIGGFEYNLDSKGELMVNLQVLLQNGNIELWNDDSIISEFGGIEEKRLEGSSKPKFPHQPGEHDDQVQSIALACMAASVYTGDKNVNEQIVLDAVNHDWGDKMAPVPNDWARGARHEQSPWSWEGRTSIWDMDDPWRG